MTVTVYIKEDEREMFESDCEATKMGFNFIQEVPLPAYTIHGVKLLEYLIHS